MPITPSNPTAAVPAPREGAGHLLAWFADMVPRCKRFALDAQARQRPIVGIMCEFAPRELILAANAVPVCLCGGDHDTIAAAETQLPACLCPLIKSTYGYWVEGSSPFLEMADLVVAESTCDGKTKMFELMARSRPTFLLALPRRDGDPAALGAWTSELRRFQAFLEARYRTAITAEGLRSAVCAMNRERRLRCQLADLMRQEHPPLTGRQLLDCKSIVSVIPAFLDQCEALLDRLQADAVAARTPLATPTPSVHRVRVLLTGVPTVHGAERVVDLIEDRGGLVVCQENCTGLKPILDDVDPDAPDLVRALAEKYFHLACSVRTPNQARLDLLRRLAQEFRAECVIDLVWHGCLTYAVEATRVRSLVESELHLPYLQLDTDYSPADTPRLAIRIEALLETARSQPTAHDPRGSPDRNSSDGPVER